MDESDKTTIKIAPFTGKQSDWSVWREKFMARAKRKGYKETLLGKTVVPAESDSLTAADKTKLAARKANNTAYEDLLLLIDGEQASGRVAFNIVRGAKTGDLPDGDAALAWKRLSDKYEPKSAPSRLALKNEFNTKVLKNANSDPDAWLTELEDLRVRLIAAGSRMDDDELLEHVLNNLPKEYEIVVSKLEDRLGSTTDPLTIEDVRSALNLKYQRLSKGKSGSSNNSKDDEHETALFAGGFKGKCNNCGEWGHKGYQCPKKGSNENGNNSGGNKFSGKCHYCKKVGHRAFECRKKKADKGNKGSERTAAAIDDNSECEELELAFMAGSGRAITTGNQTNLWIGDSGNSRHLTGSDEGMIDWVEINEPIKLADNKTIWARKKGTIPLRVIPEDGSEDYDVEMKDVYYVPELGPYNLFSITMALDKGFTLGNKGKTITLTKGSREIKFDRNISTKSGWLGAVKMVPRKEEVRVAVPKLKKNTKIDVKIFHEVLGHVGDDVTKETALYYGLKIQGSMHPCSDCLKAKARQKNIFNNNNQTARSVIAGERLGFDISSIKDLSLGGSKFWLLVVDESSDMCWSFFLKGKGETHVKIHGLICELRDRFNKMVKFLRCDNAGENKKTEEYLKEKGIGIQFEYTAPNTPQQNGKVERKFATLYGRIRATLNSLGDDELRTKLWAEAAAMMTLMENISVKKKGEKPAYTKFFGKDCKIVPFLRRFGEMAVIKEEANIIGKKHNKGIEAMFVGYAKDHAMGVYRWYCVDLASIRESRDCRFLNMNYAQWKKKEQPKTIQWVDEVELEQVKVIDMTQPAAETETLTINNPEEGRVPETTRQGKEPQGIVTTPRATETNETKPLSNRMLIRELSRLGTSYNEQAAKMAEEMRQQSNAMEEKLEVMEEVGGMAHELFGYDVAFYAALKLEGQPTKEKDESNDSKSLEELMHAMDSIVNDKKMNDEVKNEKLRGIVNLLKHYNPSTFQEAYNHPVCNFRERFREAIRKELRDMHARGVWRKIKRSDVPNGRRLVKHKWVFDIKRSGRFRARLVACGYSQIPGVDFQHSFAPTISDVSWRILIIAMLLFNYDAKIVDVETAFLHGDLEEDIYMEAPEGAGLGRDECVHLKKAIYGLVQASRQYWKHFVRALRDIGFQGGVADPCMMVRRDKDGVCFAAIWVDDTLLVGDTKAITKTITDLKQKGFTLKVENDLDDYLSCEIKIDRAKKKAWIHQPHLLRKLRDKFWNLVKDMPNYVTPGTPHQVIVRNTEWKITPEEQAIYRSGVGMLLFLIKHSRPDIANTVRELTKVLDGASPAAFKELKRVIKYVLDTEKLGLKIQPEVENGKGRWTMVTYSDSDYATDPENRLSVSGFVLYLCGVPIVWRTKQQRSVTLSSSEAEYYALSEAVKEIRFIYQLLKEMGFEVVLPITVRVDNIGAIFMAENMQVSQRTKHIDTRLRFVNQYVDDGFIKIKFVGTNENDADLFTKNLGKDAHERHGRKLVEKKG